MHLELLNAAIISLLTVIVGSVPLIKRRDRLTWLFAASNAALALWNSADFVVAAPIDHSAKLWIYRGSYLIGILTVLTFYQFFQAFTEGEVTDWPQAWNFLLIFGAGLGVAGLSPLLIKDFRYPTIPFEVPGPAYPFLICFFALAGALALRLVFSGLS